MSKFGGYWLFLAKRYKYLPAMEGKIQCSDISQESTALYLWPIKNFFTHWLSITKITKVFFGFFLGHLSNQKSHLPEICLANKQYQNGDPKPENRNLYCHLNPSISTVSVSTLYNHSKIKRVDLDTLVFSFSSGPTNHNHQIIRLYGDPIRCRILIFRHTDWMIKIGW